MDRDGRFDEDEFGFDEEGGFQVGGYEEDLQNGGDVGDFVIDQEGVVNSEEDEGNVGDTQQASLHGGEDGEVVENYEEDFVNEGQDDDFDEDNDEAEFENGEDDDFYAESPAQQIEGSRPGTSLYIDVEEQYVYRIQKTSGGRYNMRCRIRACPGTASMNVEGERRLRRLKAHDHDPPQNIVAEELFRKTLYRRAATETIPLSQIHREEAAK